MLNTSVEIVSSRKSVLNHLGKSRTFLKTLLDYGSVVSGVHPVAKTVLSLVVIVYEVSLMDAESKHFGFILLQHLEKQEQSSELILDLAENMARILGYISDVQQFARLVQLKTALADVQPLLADTTNFIIQRTAHSETSMLDLWV
jgi:hypothetical protein